MEPLIVNAARKVAKTDPTREVRVMGSTGTTVRTLVAEMDEVWDELRGDLVRRRDTLRAMEAQYHQKFSVDKREIHREDWLRFKHKADGIDIALSLLPKIEED